MQISANELEEAARKITGKERFSELSRDELWRLMTISQFITDSCLAELENKDELTFIDGVVIVPYQSDHFVETILTRQ